jgi:hypothetical protein
VGGGEAWEGQHQLSMVIPSLTLYFSVCWIASDGGHVQMLASWSFHYLSPTVSIKYLSLTSKHWYGGIDLGILVQAVHKEVH